MGTTFGTFILNVIGSAAIVLKMKMEKQAVNQERGKTKGEMIYGK